MNKTWAAAVLVSTFLIGGVSRTAAAQSSFQFASLAEGRVALSTRDDFVQRLSSFDRAARLKTDRDVSEREYLEFVANSVLPWDRGSRTERVSRALDVIERRFREMNIPMPQGIRFITTTGREEGGASYTRGDAIVLPDGVLLDQKRDLVQLISHEIFHVLSRNNPSLRTALYRIIGFEPCPEFSFPPALASRKITNPDAPRNDYRIRVKYHGQSVWAIPVLYASVEQYDPRKGGEFFAYLQFRLALSDSTGVSDSLQTRFVEVGDVEGFFEQVGRNTEYIIHPEEILADNFAFLVLRQAAHASPMLPAGILKVLTEAERQP